MVASRKANYIDAIRGWAILLVITTHCGAAFAGLPYPLKKLTNFGNYGVQLFFLASAVTLLMSWNTARARESRSLGAFYMRRFFRIAPMYYMGALIYFLAEPPGGGFEWMQLIRTLGFVNAWTPDWTPTTSAWAVVPGGWSIGVEFTFYAVFPLLATFVTSISRACALFVFAWVCAVLCNQVEQEWVRNTHEVVGKFVYFWFPNQFPVFSLGILLYRCMEKFTFSPLSPRATYGVVGAIVFVLVFVAEHPLGQMVFLAANPAPPILLATLGFMALIFTLARGADTMATHRAIRGIGVLSFSAYVLHFIFFHGFCRWGGGLIDVNATGVAAIGYFAALWVLTVSCTLVSAKIAHVLIEKPGIEVGRWLLALPRRGGARPRVAPLPDRRQWL